MIFKLKKLISILMRPTLIPAMLKGVAAGVEHESVLNSLGVCRHIVDIGANRGQFSLIARYCYPESKIDSFEPLSGPATIYERIFSDSDQVKLHSFAIGDKIADAVIHVSSRDDSSSLLPISRKQVSLFPGTEEKEVRTIKVAPLDAALSENNILPSALLKIDVQGFELSTLRGCRSLLHKFEYVYVECSFVELYEGQSFADEIISFLSDNKFALVGVYNMHYDESGKAIQADFLFSKVSI